MSIPRDPEGLLTRDGIAGALNELGYLVTSKTLATKAVRGGGPPFHKFGPRVLYPWGKALAWAQAKLGPLQHDTSNTTSPDAARPDQDHGQNHHDGGERRKRGRPRIHPRKADHSGDAAA